MNNGPEPAVDPPNRDGQTEDRRRRGLRSRADSSIDTAGENPFAINEGYATMRACVRPSGRAPDRGDLTGSRDQADDVEAARLA